MQIVAFLIAVLAALGAGTISLHHATDVLGGTPAVATPYDVVGGTPAVTTPPGNTPGH